MMFAMKGLFAIALLVTACDDSVWIEIRVPDGLAVDEVELFIARDACKDDGGDCKGVRPWTGTDTSVQPFVAGAVFEHNQDLTFVAPVRDGSASFRIAASDDRLPALMAIGVQNAADRPAVGGITLAELDMSLGARHLIATLEPAGNTTRVFRWPDPADPAREQVGCAGVRHSTDPATFVVSPGDWDCDTFPNDAPTECAPLVFKSAAASQEIDCAEPVARSGVGDVCALGKGTCVDGVGRGCDPEAPHDLCVPQELCDSACKSASCLEQKFVDAPPRIECTFPAVRGPNGFVVCGPNGRRSATTKISPNNPFPCLGTPGLTQTLLDPNPVPILGFDAAGVPASFEVATVVGPTCELGFELGIGAGLGFGRARFALHVPLGNGATSKMLIPVELTLMEVSSADCEAEITTATCTPMKIDTDSILNCKP